MSSPQSITGTSSGPLATHRPLAPVSGGGLSTLGMDGRPAPERDFRSGPACSKCTCVEHCWPSSSRSGSSALAWAIYLPLEPYELVEGQRLHVTSVRLPTCPS